MGSGLPVRRLSPGPSTIRLTGNSAEVRSVSRLIVALAALAAVAAPPASALSLGNVLDLGDGGAESSTGVDLGADLGVDLGVDVGEDLALNMGVDLGEGGLDLDAEAGQTSLDVATDAGADSAPALSAELSVDAGTDASIEASADLGLGGLGGSTLTALQADLSVNASDGGDGIAIDASATLGGAPLASATAGVGSAGGDLASLSADVGSATLIEAALGQDLRASVALDTCVIGCAAEAADGPVSPAPDSAMSKRSATNIPGRGPGPAEAPDDSTWRRIVDEPLQEPAVQAGLSASALLAAAWAAIGRHTILRRLAKVAALVPMGVGLFSRIQGDKVLEHPVRAAVQEYVEANPGATIQEIRGAVDVAWGTVVHHLRRLEAEEHLVSQREGNHRRFFVRNTISRAQRNDLAALAAENARHLALAVALRPGLRQKDLCDAVGVSNPVASKYLRRLEENGLVRSLPQSRSRLYWPTERLEAAIPLLDTPASEPVLTSRAHAPDGCPNHKHGGQKSAPIVARA